MCGPREFRREEHSQIFEGFDLFERCAIQYKLWWLSRVPFARDDHSLTLARIECEMVAADPVTDAVLVLVRGLIEGAV